MSDRKLLNIELGRVSAGEYALLPPSGIVAVLDNVRSAHNVGSVFRSADSFKVDKIYLCGICPAPPSAEIHKSALGAEDSVEWERCGSTLETVERLRAEGYTLVSVEQTVNSVKLDEFRPYSGGCGDPGAQSGASRGDEAEECGDICPQKYALIFGNEVDGVAQEVVDASDFALEIPQFGSKHSLNISVAAGVVLWHFKLDALRSGKNE